jgi:hypothetical protein
MLPRLRFKQQLMHNSRDCPDTILSSNISSWYLCGLHWQLLLEEWIVHSSIDSLRRKVQQGEWAMHRMRRWILFAGRRVHLPGDGSGPGVRKVRIGRILWQVFAGLLLDEFQVHSDRQLVHEIRLHEINVPGMLQQDSPRRGMCVTKENCLNYIFTYFCNFSLSFGLFYSFEFMRFVLVEAL